MDDQQGFLRGHGMKVFGRVSNIMGPKQWLKGLRVNHLVVKAIYEVYPALAMI